MDQMSGDKEPIAPWTVVDSRHLHRDRWISVRVDDCRTRDGISVSPYYVVEYPDWVAVVALNGNNDIVLVEQYRHGIEQVALGLPGGGIDPTDTDSIAAAKRELIEETGYAADDWTEVARLANNPPNMSNWCHIMLARGARRVRDPDDSPIERVRTKCLPLEEVRALVQKGGLPHSMDVAALLLCLATIGVGTAQAAAPPGPSTA